MMVRHIVGVVMPILPLLHHYLLVFVLVGILNSNSSVNKIVLLPEDAIDIIPEHAEQWLAKYDLTTIDFSGCQVLYSYEKELLIFAFYDDDNNLLMYQGRYFGDNKEYSKYHTRGAKDFLCILGPKTDTITVVEDILSATKVSKVTTVLCLFGSSINTDTAKRLCRIYRNLVIWLDMDKSKEALQYRNRYLPLFNEARVIMTPLDPKEYSTDEISRILQG